MKTIGLLLVPAAFAVAWIAGQLGRRCFEVQPRAVRLPPGGLTRWLLSRRPLFWIDDPSMDSEAASQRESRSSVE